MKYFDRTERILVRALLLLVMLVPLVPLTVTAVPTNVDIAEFFWSAPTTNVDGSVLVDTAGFRIYCIADGGIYPDVGTGYEVADPGALSVNINQVVDMTVNTVYYCKATAYDSEGHEGAYGPEISFLVAGGVSQRNVSVPAALPSFGVR